MLKKPSYFSFNVTWNPTGIWDMKTLGIENPEWDEYLNEVVAEGELLLHLPIVNHATSHYILKINSSKITYYDLFTKIHNFYMNTKVDKYVLNGLFDNVYKENIKKKLEKDPDVFWVYTVGELLLFDYFEQLENNELKLNLKSTFSPTYRRFVLA
jgi:hypothetical protein